jgi:hypothetical protein
VKLSEAILKGCEMNPVQGFSVYCNTDGEHMATCAFGAAGLARVGHGATQKEIDQAASATGSEVTSLRARCPVYWCDNDHVRDNVYSVVTHLNDDHLWTRESIAAWLAEQGL